ncbi:MAG TPA: molybdopterin-guanine dinucleotide biosynthesis protein B [Virgibacillus sp.]|nr:molybdopterin-guanine dinucleotide biosynthesis protein B [Virgibacillus sp.]
MKTMQIVGYKSSGKTTLTTRLIELLSARSVRVASLKHHGHGGVPLGLEETDSEKHRQAGALIAGVEGAGVLQLSNHHAWRMEQMVAIYKLLHIEVLMMEGFKTYDYDKIVLIRDNEDLHLLEQLTHIKAVITPLNLNQSSYPFPIFKREEIEAFNNWFISFLKL